MVFLVNELYILSVYVRLCVPVCFSICFVHVSLNGAASD